MLANQCRGFNLKVQVHKVQRLPSNPGGRIYCPFSINNNLLGGDHIKRHLHGGVLGLGCGTSCQSVHALHQEGQVGRLSAGRLWRHAIIALVVVHGKNRTPPGLPVLHGACHNTPMP